MKIKLIKDLDLKSKRVFLRADLNVPLKDKKILQDYRLKAILPTIDYIQKHGGKVILATHIGRPKAKDVTNYFDENLSTEILLNWFTKNGYKIKHEKDLLEAQIKSKEDFNEILLLENLRFFNGEQGSKEERLELAELLTQLADVYVNDAFGLIHRDDTSVTLLPEMFDSSQKAIGLLIEKEIKELDKLKHNPEKPFALVLGGAKIKDKIALLENFLKETDKKRVDSIIIGGAIAYTFLKAQGHEVGKSLVENDFLEFAQNMLNLAKSKEVNILLPLDHLVSENNSFKFHETSQIPQNGFCVDIGPKTIELYKKEIEKAKTIFTNGTMGIYTKPETSNGSKEILQAIAQSNTYTVAGGGDCVAAAFQFNLQDKFDFLSTGGGATLAFLSTEKPEENLPGLKRLFISK